MNSVTIAFFHPEKNGTICKAALVVLSNRVCIDFDQLQNNLEPTTRAYVCVCLANCHVAISAPYQIKSLVHVKGESVGFFSYIVGATQFEVCL